MSEYRKRNFGLDVIRSIAILLVIINHIYDNNSVVFYYFGFFGVELFFVLSGFLIGQILIREFTKHNNFKTLKIFWVRRWFRTLPMYFLVLILTLIFFDNEGFSWRHLFFLQNFSSSSIKWFPVSWSLVIEEWFYLITPCLLFLIPNFKNEKLSVAIKILFFMLIVFIIRSNFVLHNNYFDIDFKIRKNILFRLDSLMFGVLLAFIKLNYNILYKKLQSKMVFFSTIFTFFTLLCVGNILIYDFKGIRTTSSTIGISLISFLFTLLIPYFENSNYINKKIANINIIKYIITKISILTYSIYLIHYQIFSIIIKADVTKRFKYEWIPEAILALFITIVLSALFYRFYEKPMMNLRDKYK